MRLRRRGPAQPRQGVPDLAPLRRARPPARACGPAAVPGYSEILSVTAATTVRGVLLAASIAWAATAGVVLAGPFEDGDAALARGDTATALKLYRALAAEGHTAAQTRLGVM